MSTFPRRVIAFSICILACTSTSAHVTSDVRISTPFGPVVHEIGVFHPGPTVNVVRESQSSGPSSSDLGGPSVGQISLVAFPGTLQLFAHSEAFSGGTNVTSHGELTDEVPSVVINIPGMEGRIATVRLGLDVDYAKTLEAGPSSLAYATFSAGLIVRSGAITNQSSSWTYIWQGGATASTQFSGVHHNLPAPEGTPLFLDVQFRLNSPFHFAFWGTAQARVSGTGPAVAEMDLGHSIYWRGIDAVVVDGVRRTDFSLNSSAGWDLRSSYVPTVPEPTTWALLLTGLLVTFRATRGAARREVAPH